MMGPSALEAVPITGHDPGGRPRFKDLATPFLQIKKAVLKSQYGLDSKYDIFSDKSGNMYYGPRQGTGTNQYMHMNKIGPR
jgi:hypothetical protein